MRVNNLSNYEKKLVLVATLLDPEFAVDCLAMDQNQGSQLALAADELVQMSPEMRLPFVGSLLRSIESANE